MEFKYLQGYWEQKDGHLKKITEMHDQHLVNCYKNLKGMNRGSEFDSRMDEIENEMIKSNFEVCPECGAFVRMTYDGVCENCFRVIYANEFNEVRKVW